MEEITFIIQTFLRPECLEKLLESIKRFYPDVKVLVNDDSEHNRGISWGRNHLVSQVETPYYLLLDDDFIFTEETKIEILLEKIKTGYDLVAGALREGESIKHHEGIMMLKDEVLHRIPKTKEPYDYVYNFFLAKKEVTGWRENYKLAEHTPFFWDKRGEIKIAYMPECIVTHKPDRNKEYARYRSQTMPYIKDFMAEQGLIEII